MVGGRLYFAAADRSCCTSYFLLAKVALTLASVHPIASLVWPPTGLALASFMLWGNRLWPAIAAAALLANATTYGSLFTSSMIAGRNTAAEAVDGIGQCI